MHSHFCPSCRVPIETNDHVFQCGTKQWVDMINIFLALLKKQLSSIGIESQLNLAIIHGIKAII